MTISQWISAYFEKKHINEETIKPAKDFLLLWNLFEYIYYDSTHRLSPTKLLQLAEIAIQYIDFKNYESFFTFFKKRYIERGETNQKFEGLYFERENDEMLVRNTLINPSTNLEKLKALLLITYRFRNNLFHGRKEPVSINLYERPFKELNSFLMRFIEDTGKNDKVNNKRFSG